MFDKPPYSRDLMVAWLLAAITFCVLTFEYVIRPTLTDTRRPIELGRVEALNSPLAVGERLTLRVYRKKVRADCEVVSQRSAISQDGLTFDIPDQVWPGGEVSADFVDLTIATSALPPGDYILTIKTSYICPDNVAFSYDPIFTRFRVE